MLQRLCATGENKATAYILAIALVILMVNYRMVINILGATVMGYSGSEPSCLAHDEQLMQIVSTILIKNISFLSLICFYVLPHRYFMVSIW